MVDVNEQIVMAWLQHIKKEFPMESVRYLVKRARGSGWSDMDILSTDGKGNFTDYEIKWRSVVHRKMTNEMFERIISDFDHEERVRVRKQITGDSPVRKVVVATKSHLKRGQKEAFIEREVDIVYFEDIIQQLVSKIDVEGRYVSLVPQLIRMLKWWVRQNPSNCEHFSA